MFIIDQGQAMPYPTSRRPSGVHFARGLLQAATRIVKLDYTFYNFLPVFFHVYFERLHIYYARLIYAM